MWNCVGPFTWVHFANESPYSYPKNSKLVFLQNRSSCTFAEDSANWLCNSLHCSQIDSSNLRSCSWTRPKNTDHSWSRSLQPSSKNSKVGNQNWILRASTLYIVFAALHALRKTAEGRGLDSYAIESGIYTSATIRGIFVGKRTTEVLKTISQWT